ncbi:hypothetical protein ACIB24_21035 [Spongisporangium articulatum]|uniref:O-antigen polysaccharide polymerase Wzy n=1 Tax=Spongisporangium articulatum TaxID=3362603 RepID=A0ABW8AT36_9ACTN
MSIAALTWSSPERAAARAADRGADRGARRTADAWRATFVLAAVLPALPLAVQIVDARLAALTLGILGVCAYGVVESCTGGARPMALLFWVFNGIWLGVGSLYQLAAGRVAWGDTLLLGDTNRVIQAQALTLACLLAFAVGYTRRRTSAPAAAPLTHFGRALLLGYGFAGLAVVLLPRVAGSVGGVGGLFHAREAADGTGTTATAATDAAERAADGFLRILPASLALAAAFIALTTLLQLHAVRDDDDDPRPRLAVGLAGLLAVIGVGLMVLYANPLSMSRYISVSMFAALAVLVGAPRRPRAAAVTAAIAVAGLLLVYPLAYTLRGLPSEVPPGSSRWAALSTNDFDGFQQVVNTVQYTQDLGHTYGLHTLSAALYVVPRSIWTAKARSSSLDVAEHRGYQFIDLSEPLHAELFLDFGWGAVLLMGGVGLLWRRLDDAWLTRAGPPALLVPYLCVGQLGLLRGPLGSLVPVIATTTGLLAVALWARRGHHPPDHGTSRGIQT